MGNAYIIGVGATDFSKDSGRSELRLAVEATKIAIEDAGIEPGEVDGFTALTVDNTRPYAVARSLGLAQVSYFAEIPEGGGGGCAAVGLAAEAAANGLADVVVVYRAMNERSGLRYGRPATDSPEANPNSFDLDASWTRPYGLGTPGAQLAMTARRYMHEHNLPEDAFGWVSVQTRKYASTNPNAWFYEKPITISDHKNSRMISEPLRLLDCCQESDGAVALVVVSDRHRAAGQGVKITAHAQGVGPDHVLMSSFYRSDISTADETRVMGEQLWSRSGLTVNDMSAAILYDHFSPGVLMQLEALGVCAPGEGAAFVRAGGLALDGPLPSNMNGGQLGEAYIHGFNGIAEAVRQLRGQAINQVADAKHVLVTSGSHVPTSGLILSRTH